MNSRKPLPVPVVRCADCAQAWLVPEIAARPRAKADLISTEDMMRAAGIRIATSQVSIRAEAAVSSAASPHAVAPAAAWLKASRTARTEKRSNNETLPG